MTIDATDQKNRWCGILENPLISKVQRNCLDAGRNRGLKASLSDYNFESVLDIGCGLGETSKIFSCPYTGVDNSAPRISYASRKYPLQKFIASDAQQLDFDDNSFDAVLMIDTSHHLNDDAFVNVLTEMVRLSRRYIIVSDPVYFEGQSGLSRYFYGLDRGGCFRTDDQMRSIFNKVRGLILEKTDHFTTFPGLYKHSVFALKVDL